VPIAESTPNQVQAPQTLTQAIHKNSFPSYTKASYDPKPEHDAFHIL